MTRIGLLAIVALALGSGVGLGQTAARQGGAPVTARAGSGNAPRHMAPTDKALDFPLEMINAEFADEVARKIATARLMEGGRFSLNARHIVGAENATSHPATYEFYFIRQGTGTLVTGGTIVNNKVQGGVERPVKAGDVVYIPPKTPHMLTNVPAPGISWLNIHFE